MAPLTSDRDTPTRLSQQRVGTVAADQTLFAGALLMRDANGDLKSGATETGSFGVGRAERAVSNAGGAAGDVTAPYISGVFRYLSEGGADLIGKSHVGTVCYIVDDETVAATDGGGTRSPAGFVDDVTNAGVWVRFDEAMLRTI